MATLVEYGEGEAFPGTIGRTVGESSPAWPEPIRAKDGAPNILFFVLDDVGYGQLSCFGGGVETPNIDRVAAAGLRYTAFQTTAVCSPTRACLLTGRNHHSSGVACIMEVATGYPGYDGRMPFTNGMLPEMLTPQGYNTFCVGKWHLSPSEENTAAGPFHRWPMGRGFERYYGFLGGETNQWYPELIQDNHGIEPPKLPEKGYHLSEDLADQAIRMVLDAHASAPEKPFLLYYATGAGHAPHHVAPEWSERYAGKFDGGWQKYRDEVFARQKELGIIAADAQLPPADPDVPEWDTLSADEQRLYSRMMEVYAGFLSHADHHFGRILDMLEKIGELDNTLVCIVSDNGASAEGGPRGSINEMLFFNNIPESIENNLAAIDQLGSPTSYNHYAWGWTWAGNTPFRRWKRETYRGGATTPMIISWPDRIPARGEVRRQYVHAIDLVPTILDALETTPPPAIRGITQTPLEGVSFLHTFDDESVATRHTTQYFEMLGHRAIDHDGWRAVCPWPGPSFAEAAEHGRAFGQEIDAETLFSLDTDGWELYHIETDPTESTDLASSNRERLIDLITRWYAEAGKYKVFPIDGTVTARLATQRPQTSKPRTSFTFYPGGGMVPAFAAPPVYNRPHSIQADIEIPEAGAEGVIICQGGAAGGYVFYMKDDRLRYAHNYQGIEIFEVASDGPLPAGRHTVRFEFEPTGPPDIAHGRGVPANLELYVDGKLVGAAAAATSTPLFFELEGLSCGYDACAPVLYEQYSPPFTFTGTIHEVVIDLSGDDLIEDDQAMIARLMATQ